MLAYERSGLKLGETYCSPIEYYDASSVVHATFLKLVGTEYPPVWTNTT